MFSEKYAQLERGVHEQVEQDLMDLGGGEVGQLSSQLHPIGNR